MPVVRALEVARAIPTPPPEPDRSWTEQPGSDGEWLCVDVLASSEPHEIDAHTIASFKLENASKSLSAPVSSGSVVRLRDYQEEAVSSVFSAWEGGKTAPLIVAATGSGKTVIGAEVMRRAVERGPTHRAVFLAHRRELLDQTVGKVKLVAPRCTVGLVQASLNEIGRRITVASVQTLATKNGERVAEVIGDQPPTLVVVDECHHATSATYLKVLEAFREANPNVKLLGLTATPGRADGTALDKVFDHVAFERNLFDLIRDGYLVPPKGTRVTLDINLDSVEKRNGEFVETQLAKVMNQPSVCRGVVRAWQEYGHDRKMIVFCVNVAHAKALAQEFTDAGYPAAAIDGSMKERDRAKVYEKFRHGHIKLLCSVDVLTEGYDEPSIEGVIFARPTQSQALYAQCLGRGLRLYPGKTECLVIDCVGVSEKHSPVQLATLAGLKPVENENLPPDEHDGEYRPKKTPEATVNGLQGRELDFRLRSRKTRYSWRETTYGWTLQIPRVGYFLVAWHDKDQRRATVRFHDLREGRRAAPPVEVVREPIDFEMAYGLVEGEVERMASARFRRSGEQDDKPQDNAFWGLFDDGLEDDISEYEHMMLNEADWRSKPITSRQSALLTKMGVKPASIPSSAGEASDLLTVLSVERDVKQREPMTDKQRWYLTLNHIPFESNTTKLAAKKLILDHRQGLFGFRQQARK